MRVSNERVSNLAAKPKRRPGGLGPTPHPPIVHSLARDLQDARAEVEKLTGIAQRLANELQLSGRYAYPVAKQALEDFYTYLGSR